MSSVHSPIADPDRQSASNDALGKGQPARSAQQKNYKGFVAGVFSGIGKLSVGHPFDTIKTVRREGLSGLYKGATPPLVGWMFMDSVMLGSLTFYRRFLLENVFSTSRFGSIKEQTQSRSSNGSGIDAHKLPTIGHGIAGILAGSTVSFVAAPVEHVKARLQIQYAADKSKRLYSGPINCLSRIYRAHGVPGVFHGLSATLIFRSFFFFWWSSYDLFTRFFDQYTRLSTPSINFWAGGLSAQIFWLTSYPSDVIKQRIMTDPLGGTLKDGERRYGYWKDAVIDVWRRDGIRGYWRGFLPCFLRAFPANAVALAAFEGVMRALPD